MTPRKRTSTKPKTAAPQQQEKWAQTPEAIGRDTWKMAGWSRAKYRLLGQLFPWFGPAVEKACPYDPKNPPWTVNSEALQQIRLRADTEWTALTGLPHLDCGDPKHWVAAAGRAGYSVAQARQMTVEQLAEIILQWALVNQTETARKSKGDDAPIRQTTNRDTGYKPAALAAELGLNTTGTVNKYAKLAGITTPRRGERNYTYPTADVETLCRYLSIQGSDSSTRNKAKRLLEMLPKIAR